jgi:carboxyl-terminal processing protease
MPESLQRIGRTFFSTLMLAGILIGPARATEVRQAARSTDDELWRKTVNLVGAGDFGSASDAIRQIKPGVPLTDQVRAWLDAYAGKQKARRELNREDYDKYVAYARQRIERKEFVDALGWLRWAVDVAEDRDALLSGKWVQELVNNSLASADEARQDNRWRDAWRIYTQLAELYEREPRFEKLEREAATHLRLDNIFKKDSHWDERIEHVQWRDAKQALDYIDMYYVVPPDFKQIAEHGLEQLLLLAESNAAQERFAGLGNDADRADFEARIRARLDQIRAAPSLGRSAAVDHFRRVVKDINTQTVRLPEEVIVSELARGALDPLDEFTTIIWPEETEEFEKHTRGDFIGVGISIIKNRMDEIEVVTPLDDTPAFRAGVQAGDIITKVDGNSLEGYSLNKVVDTITGPAGTDVTLTIRRDGQDLQFDLTRTKVKIASVKGWQRNPDETWNHWLDKENGIAYIRLTNFQKNTAEDLANTMSQLQAEKLNGLILDLRWNPGGLLDSAWQVTSMFLHDKQTVVSTKGRSRDDDHTLPASGNGAYADVPLVVLVDESSASASEIVSGAIRDNHRGIVIGERTFGKFSVQNLIPLGPSRAKLKLTTARYYLPSGDSLHREPGAETWGVEPEIPVRLVRKEQSKAFLLRREADLLGPPAPKNAPADDEKADGADTTDDEAKKPSDEIAIEDTDKAADADDKDELPPLEQPDENNRPAEDPQVDAALLVLRIQTLADDHPTIATADRDQRDRSASP